MQHVEHATHVHGHTLDLIISRKSDTTIYGAPRIDRFLSDHGAVHFTINSNRPDITVKTVSYRKLKSIDMNAFRLAIADSDLCLDPPDNPEDLAMCYNNTLKKIVDDHAPLVIITRTTINRPRVPWITEEIRASKRERRRAENKWRRSKSEIDFAEFKKKRNLTTALMDIAREDSYADVIAENSHNQGKLFCATCSLLNKETSDKLPASIDAQSFVDDFGSFFFQKIVDIRARLDTEETSVSSSFNPEVSTLPPETMEEFKDLTEDDVKSLIQRSSSKSCSLDPIPSKLLHQCDVLLPVITSLINMSLRTGVVPRALKEALITPLLKKPGADMHVPQNFRPVSNLSKMSKLTETAVCHQIQNHLLEHNIYPDQPSAYRKEFSTETLLLKVRNDLLMSMNKQHVTLLVLLDLSAAFDPIDHKMLIDLLKTRYGITNVPLRWFESYLENRAQRVVVNGAESRSFDLQFGLAQGSCLGPLLFTIYTGEISDIIKPHLPSVMCYADDTQLYVSFSPKDNCGEDEIIAAMERCIKDVRKWMKEAKLQLNTDKTELLLIGTVNTVT